jgi:hypothetical protein
MFTLTIVCLADLEFFTSIQFRDLLVDQGSAHKAGAYDITAHAMFCTFFCDHSA